MPVIRINSNAFQLLLDEHHKSRIPMIHLASDAIENTFKKHKKKNVDPRFNDIKEIFFDMWEEQNGFKYLDFGPADAAHIKQIIAKLDKINIKDADIRDMFKLIMERLPDFYRGKNIKIINGKLTEIIATIKRDAINKDQQTRSHFGF